LSAVFDAVPVSKGKADEFVRSLSSIPVEHLAIVVDRMIDTRTSGFMPTPGEIKDAYVDLVAGPPMPDERLQQMLDVETEQYRQAKADYYARDIMTRGAFDYRTQPPAAYPDAVTAETVRLIGWRDLIEMDKDMRKGLWAKRYAEARALVAKRIQAGEVRLQLPQPENVRPIKAGVA
jgi:hypothetical protein